MRHYYLLKAFLKGIATHEYCPRPVGKLTITVKPFNLAALKFGDLACKIILAAFILAN